MSELLERRTLLASIVVSSTADTGAGTLRQAILDANATSAADTITFGLGAGAHTINLASALPNLSSDLTIHGPASPPDLTIRRDTGGNYAVFLIGGLTTVSLSGMTIANGLDDSGGGIANNGTLTVDNCVLSGNGGGGLGNAGVCTLSNSTLSGNSSNYNGGGISNGGSLTVTHCLLSGNSSEFGAGIYNSGTLALADSTISGSTGAYGGGGIENYGPLTIDRCTIKDNKADYSGGGLRNFSSNTIVRDSTFSNNKALAATFNGGGYGGAIHNFYPDFSVINCTFNGNSAVSGGGALYEEQGGNIISSTISGNTASSGGGIYYFYSPPLVSDSIVAQNSGGDVSGLGGSVDLGNFNFVGGNPMLGPLANNGGPTLTMAPLPGSPCINGGDPGFAGPPDFDQRGAPFARLSGPTVDIGAVEVPATVLVVDNTGDVSDGDYSHLHQTLREAIQRADAAPGNYEIHFDPAVFSTPQVIQLTGPLPGLSTDIGIFGPGAGLLTVRRNTGGDYRIFTVDAGKRASLWGMTITNGVGGVLSDGTLSVRNDVITGNNAPGGFGGGIKSDLSALAVNDSAISGNTGGAGGAIWVGAGLAEIVNSTIDGNQATGSGGGVFNQAAATLTVQNSTVSNDTAGGSGGGILNLGKTTVSNSTLSVNSALNGAGIFSDVGSTLNVGNATIARNTTTGNGGGVFNFGVFTLNNSVIALNTAISGADVNGTFTGSFNFIGTDHPGVDPKLGPLADNGGTTQTIALLQGSPCINAGLWYSYPTPLPPYDQRGPGHARVVQNIIDLGAYEYDGPFNESLVVTTTADEDNGTSDPAYGAGTSLREAINYANEHPGHDSIALALGAGPHTIHLINGGLGLNSDMDIHASNLTLDGSNAGTIFYVDYNVSVALSGMILVNAQGDALANFGTLAIDNCTFHDDAGVGGGIYNDGAATLSVTNSTFNHNFGSGAAIFNYGHATLVNSTFTDNTSEDVGGALYNGAIMTLINCTIAGNHVTGYEGYVYDPGLGNYVPGHVPGIGGGIYSYGSLTLHNTIVAQNTGEIDPDISTDPSGTTDTSDHNFIGGDPMLGALADNGGPTMTMALLPGSPCINAGSNAAAAGLATDQRGTGYARIVGGTVDIGAFELETPPTADAGGPYNTVEGGAVALDGLASRDGEQTAASLTYAWDLDADGIYGETGAGATHGNETGATPTFVVGNLDGTHGYVVSLRVTDDQGRSSTDTATINVADVSPTAGITGPSDKARGQSATFKLTATDPSAADKAAGFKYSINWGDGSAVQLVNATANNGGGINVNHTFANVGVYAVTLTAKDKDGGVSSAVTKQITISGAQLIRDPANAHSWDYALLVGGTSGNDNIQIEHGWEHGIMVLLNNTSLGTFHLEPHDIDRLIVLGQEGNDTINVDKNLSLPKILYGNAGNDSITSGKGSDIFIGGDGDDVLTGSKDRDIFMGGNGKDKLVGADGDDILIAGSTSYDTYTSANAAALVAIQAEWNRSIAYSTRIAHLTGTSTGGVNGSAFFKVSGVGQTVFNDSDIDSLTGGSGSDWFLLNRTGAGVLDVSDRTGSETATDL